MALRRGPGSRDAHETRRGASARKDAERGRRGHSRVRGHDDFPRFLGAGLLGRGREYPDRGTQQRNIKMWFDFDNACFWPDKYLPSHPLKCLKDGSSTFYNKVSNCVTTPTSVLTCFFIPVSWSDIF